MTPGDTLYSICQALAERNDTAPAVTDLSFVSQSNFGELLHRVDRLADGLQARGVSHGKRVLWLGQNSSRVLETLLACARIGAIFCPVNWRQSIVELEFVIDDLEPTVVFWQDQEIGDTIGQLRQFNKPLGSWVQHDGVTSDYEALLAEDNPAQLHSTVASDDPTLLLYTAAFDGQPNGAVLSHRAVIAQSRNYAAVRQLDSSARYLNIGPLFHVATLLETMATFCAGGLNVFIRRAEAATICEAIESQRCNGAFLLPPIIQEIVDYAREHPVNLKTLKTLPASPEWNALITEDDSAWGRTPYGFGQTETFGYATYCALAADAEGKMGKPAVGVQVCALDETGQELPPGEAGEIAVRGDTVMLHYWRRDSLSHERRTNGWHRCNDIGRLEQDGSLTFIGPKTQMIRSGQENIYPAEVENCLKQHPCVADAAVIGVPDPQWDQSVKAIVVLEENANCGEDELIAHCKQHIASYKKPKQVVFVTSLPRKGATPDYGALDSSHGGGGYPGRDRE